MRKISKRLVAAILAALLLCPLVPSGIAQAAEIPAGHTPIYTAEDLASIRGTGDNIKYILMNDIDLSGWGNWEPLEEYAGLNFDGNGFAVIGLKVEISAGEEKPAGLFSKVTNGTIKNLRLVDCDISNESEGDTGAIAAFAQNMTILNCSVTGTVRGDGFTGGLIGRATNCQIQFSANESAVTSASGDTGGIAGFAFFGKFVNTSNSGGVSGTDAGGIAGSSQAASYERCSNAGAVAGARAGGVVGTTASVAGWIEYCENRGDIKGGHAGGIAGNTAMPISYSVNFADLTVTSADAYVGGISGGIANLPNISNCRNLGAIQVAATGLAAVGGIASSAGAVTNCVNAGDVTVSAGGRCNAGGIAASASSVSACYSDGGIDVTGNDVTNVGGIVGNAPPSASGELSYSWNTGSVEASVSSTAAGTALNIGGIAGLSRINVLNCANSGDISGIASQNVQASVGGITGYQESAAISDCRNDGKIDARAQVQPASAGGIVGESISADLVERCGNAGAIASISSSNYAYAGGIAGRGTAIAECWNTGAVDANAGGFASAGGVAGALSSSIDDCWNAGSISAATTSAVAGQMAYAGGLVAYLSGALLNCYNVGALSSSTPAKADIGGIVARATTTASLTNANYLGTAVAGVADSEGGSITNVVARDDTQMRVQGNYTGFDFGTTWAMPGGGYPVLRDNAAAKYVVAYNANTGTGAPAGQAKLHDTALTLRAEEPSCAGYMFAGWSVDPAGTADYPAGGTYTENADVMLYATWQANKYTVTLNANGGTAPGSVEATYGGFYDLPVPVRPGYTFSGWSSTASYFTKVESGDVVDILANRTFFAFWTVNRYTLTFDPNGGVGNFADMTVTYGEIYGILSQPTRTGYTFDNWYVGDTKIGGGDTVKITEDSIAVARWNPKRLLICLNPGPVVRLEKYSFWAEYDSAYPAFPKVDWPGYTLVGWFTESEGKQVREGDAIRTAQPYSETVNARWKALSYTVTLDPNGGTTPVKSVKATHGQPYKGLPTPTRKGYTFQGWMFDGGEIANGCIVDITEDATFVARWYPAHYRVTFDPNGGEVDWCESLSVTYDATYGDSWLPIPIRQGYTFAGWYLDGKKINDTDIVKITENKTFSARWTANRYTVKLDPDGGTVSLKSVTVTYDCVYDLPTPTRGGYTFAGWYDDSGRKITQTSTVNLPYNHTLHASWNVIPLRLTRDFVNLNPRKTGKITVENASGKVTFTGHDDKIATVDQNGNVFAKRPGTMVVSVKSSAGQSGTLVVNVKYSFWQWLCVIFLLGWFWVPVRT